MTKNSNKHSSRYAKHSSRLHTSKSRIFHSPPAATFARGLIIAVILLACVAVTVSVVSSFLLNDEAITKSQISTLAADYYENYFYPLLVNSEKFQQLEDQNAVMDKYHLRGVDVLTLSDLLLYDHQRNATYADYLSSQCDINSTLIRIYPDPPYDVKSYHVEYVYSCNF